MIVGILIGMVLGGLGLSLWFLNNWLAEHALAVLHQGQWVLLNGSDGWVLPTQLGPIMLPLALLVLLVSGGLGLWLSQVANRADVAQFKKRTQQAEQAQATAEQRAYKQAQAEIEQERQQLEVERERLLKYQDAANQARQQAQQQQQSAQQAVAQARQEAEAAQHKKTKAMAFNERKKKKADRLRHRIQAGETITLAEVEAALR